MRSAATNQDGHFTYKDYLEWPEDERWEVFEGVAYNMSPAPSTFHQQILGELFGIFWSYLKNKTCTAFIAPFDVRLAAGNRRDDEIDTVVQPDISVICDPAKLDERGCKGAPDLIIEITSPATAGRDMKEKLLLYEKYGVKEYWIVHPDVKVVELFSLSGNGQYSKPDVFTVKDRIAVGLFPGLAVDLDAVFNIKKADTET